MEFLQCQTVQHNILKSSPNNNIRSLWKNTCEGSNIQYDIYRNTKEALKAIRTEYTERLQHELTSQGYILSFLLDNSLKMANSVWSTVQSNMPRNIFNFTVRYLNNSLANRVNLVRWNLSQTSDCSFCFRPESLLHVIAGCKTYLDEGRFTWRHNSALQFIANSLQSIVGSTLYVDLPCFLSPCIITGDTLRPDLLLVTADRKLFVLDLTVGFETNLDINAHRKKEKYHQLLQTLSSQFSLVKFVNLSVSCLSIFGCSADSFIDMCKDLEINKNHLLFMIRTTSAIIIRSTYIIFCRRNKPWTSPDFISF